MKFKHLNKLLFCYIFTCIPTQYPDVRIYFFIMNCAILLVNLALSVKKYIFYKTILSQHQKAILSHYNESCSKPERNCGQKCFKVGLQGGIPENIYQLFPSCRHTADIHTVNLLFS